jgi:hypothetical protein
MPLDSRAPVHVAPSVSLSAPPPAGHPAPCAPRRAALADRVARAFPPLACVRGFRYFARRKVSLSSISDQELTAEVKGTRTQRVRLRVEGGSLGASCSCSAKVLGPACCRHVWATLLELDRQEFLPALRSTGRPLALVALEGLAAPPRPRRSPRATKERRQAPPTRAARGVGSSGAK